MTLRHHPFVEAWISAYQEGVVPREDCRLCGWPHRSMGCGSTFGQVWLGGDRAYVDASNVDYLVQLISGLSSLGFHWKNEWFFNRKGDTVVVSRIEYFNGVPSVKQISIPISELASIMCSVSVDGETGPRYAEATKFLGVVQR